MGCRKNRIADGCIKTPSRCVFYDLELPEFSKLNLLQNCINLEDTTTDLYQITDFVLDSINLKDVDKGTCVTFPVTKSKYDKKEVVLVKDAIKTLVTELCKLKKKDGGTDDVLEGLDLKCLKECETKVTSLTALLQLLIDEICKLKEKK